MLDSRTEGSIEEKKYLPQKDGILVEDECSILKPGEISWMHNSIGYHKVTNPSPNTKAATLHIYSPPYKSCKGLKENGEYWYCVPRFYSLEGERLNENNK